MSVTWHCTETHHESKKIHILLQCKRDLFSVFALSLFLFWRFSTNLVMDFDLNQNSNNKKSKTKYQSEIKRIIRKMGENTKKQCAQQINRFGMTRLQIGKKKQIKWSNMFQFNRTHTHTPSTSKPKEKNEPAKRTVRWVFVCWFSVPFDYAVFFFRSSHLNGVARFYCDFQTNWLKICCQLHFKSRFPFILICDSLQLFNTFRLLNAWTSSLMLFRIFSFAFYFFRPSCPCSVFWLFVCSTKLKPSTLLLATIAEHWKSSKHVKKHNNNNNKWKTCIRDEKNRRTKVAKWS